MEYAILDLPIYESFIDECFPKSKFYEFCQQIDALQKLIEEPEFFTESAFITEAVGSPKIARKNAIKEGLRKGAKTTKAIGRVYNTITDIKARPMESSVNLLTKLATIVGRICVFFTNNISKVIDGASTLIEKIGDIPDAIKHKIRGDINLYITASDIQVMYSKQVFQKLKTFCAIANKLICGETWSTFANHGLAKILTVGFAKTDMDRCRQLSSLYKDLQKLEFSKTLINMQKPENIDLYLSKSKNLIKFKGLDNAYHQVSYLQALKIMCTDIASMKKDVQVIEKGFDKKLDLSYDTTSGNYGDLATSTQERILETSKQISGVVKILSSFLKYITSDINTVEKAMRAIANKIDTAETKIKTEETPETNIVDSSKTS